MFVALLFRTLRSVIFIADERQADLHGVAQNCAVLQQKIVRP
jgi:hypothetical protein